MKCQPEHIRSSPSNPTTSQTPKNQTFQDRIRKTASEASLMQNVFDIQLLYGSGRAHIVGGGRGSLSVHPLPPPPSPPWLCYLSSKTLKDHHFPPSPDRVSNRHTRIAPSSPPPSSLDPKALHGLGLPVLA
ncbi:hypothetical protein FQA47_022907 [Oryzias melastigma]|uniref:Uncharacterized protein n=1 Tax=Oryzias melastigma TaxID=30732 RepID=A0A834CAQ8_ORYME|nr:hypothetical protein FQA47_022907 [Oryzias melastigma]